MQSFFKYKNIVNCFNTGQKFWKDKFQEKIESTVLFYSIKLQERVLFFVVLSISLKASYRKEECSSTTICFQPHGTISEKHHKKCDINQ